MKICVCIKQVPRHEGRMDSVRGVIDRSAGERIINPHDESALELALRLRDEMSARLHAVSMGPGFAEQTLRDACASGADAAFLISGSEFSGADIAATSYALSLFTADYDVIICGSHTTDGGTGQTGSAIAARLGIPFVGDITSLEACSENDLTVRCLSETAHSTFQIQLPCVLSPVSGAFPLRMPNIKSKLASKKAEIIRLCANDLGGDSGRLGLAGSKTRVTKILTQEREPVSPLLDADTTACARAIWEAVGERGIS